MAHTKLVQFDPSYITDPNQLNAFQLDVPPYQFFNGTGNPSSDVIDISSYSASGLAPSNASQQQTSNIADAKSNDVTQTMEFVSQGKILDRFISFCYIKHINMHNNMKQSHFSDARKSFSLQ